MPSKLIKIDNNVKYHLLKLFLSQESGLISVESEADAKKYVFALSEHKLLFTKSSQADEHHFQIALKKGYLAENVMREHHEELKQLTVPQQITYCLDRQLVNLKQMEEIFRAQFEIRLSRATQINSGKLVWVPQPKEKLKSEFIYVDGLSLFWNLLQDEKNEAEETAHEIESISNIDFPLLNQLAKSSAPLGSDLKSMFEQDVRVSRSHLDKLDEAGIKALYIIQSLGLIQMRFAKKAEKISLGKGSDAMSVDQLSAFYRKLKAQNFFERLGVSFQVEKKALDEAYMGYARQYHPDRVSRNEKSEEREWVERIFRLFSEAYSTLLNPSFRQEYIEKITDNTETISDKMATEIIESELLFQEAMVLLKRGRIDQALSKIRQSIEKYDEEPEYHAFHAWVSFRKAVKEKNTTEITNSSQSLEKILAKHDKMSEAFYYMGVMHKYNRNYTKAKVCFEKCVADLPYHDEALTELRFIKLKLEKRGR